VNAAHRFYDQNIGNNLIFGFAENLQGTTFTARNERARMQPLMLAVNRS